MPTDRRYASPLRRVCSVWDHCESRRKGPYQLGRLGFPSSGSTGKATGRGVRRKRSSVSQCLRSVANVLWLEPKGVNHWASASDESLHITACKNISQGSSTLGIDRIGCTTTVQRSINGQLSSGQCFDMFLYVLTAPH